MTTLTITLAANRLAPSAIVGQAALYDTLAVTVTGVPWDTGHSYIAYLAKDATYMGGTSVITVSFAAGIATWTFSVPFTHSALIAACVGAPLPVHLRLWDATAGQHVCAAPLTVQYAPEPDGWVQSDPVETAATAGQIATAVTAHNAAADRHTTQFAAKVAGPASATDGRPALFDGATGKLLKQHGSALGTAAAAATGDFEAAGGIATHSALTTGVHGVAGSTVASAADIATHAALTQTHGITAFGASVVDDATAAAARATLAAYRAQTVAAPANAGGAVTLAFATDLILQLTLTSNWTSSNEPTGLADGETAAAFATLSGFTIYAAPADTATAKYGPWTVTGPIVRVGLQRVASVYYWTAVSF